MASPFPGMDPYLEGEFWQEFHETLACEIRMQLMPLIKPKYVALLAKRYVLHQPALSLFGLPPEDSFYPDVHIVAPPKSPQPLPMASATGVMTKPAATLANWHYVPQLRLEIKQASNQRLITVIELLAPANKYGGGHAKYNKRRIQLMQASVSLFEIDLSR